MSDERLQKLLARAGHGSRRSAESLIEAGRVRVNGKVVSELGAKADPDRDLITLDNQPLEVPETPRTFAFYKPESVVTTMRDPEGRKCVGDYIDRLDVRVFPVGRLDWDAEGLLLLTSDGELAHRLMHPRWGVKRTYLVKVKGDPTPEALQRLVSGVRLDDGDGRATEASFERATDKNAWVKIVVREGRNHFVKRLCEAIGHPVQRLFRVEYAGVRLGALAPGRFRELGANEVRELLAATAEEAPRPAGDLRRAPRPRPEPTRGDRAAGARPNRFGGRPPDRGASRRSDDGAPPAADDGAAGAYAEREDRSAEGDRNGPGGARSSFGERKGSGGGRTAFGDRPAPRGDRTSFGDRPAPRSDRKRAGDRPAPRGARKTFGDRPAARGDRKTASDRPAPRGDRKTASDRPAPRGDRRTASDRPAPRGDRKTSRERPSARGDRKPSGDRSGPRDRKVPGGQGRSTERSSPSRRPR